MENNNVILHGTIKRDARGVKVKDTYILDFAISVWSDSAQRWDIFDCRTTRQTEAYKACDGYFTAGDTVTVEGCLEKITSSSEGKIGGKTITIRSTNIIVFVENIIDMEEVEDEY